MDSRTQLRIKNLEFLLKNMTSIKLRDAANILNVSEMTLRRDLNSESGSVILLGGYIVKNPEKDNEGNYLIFEQETRNLKEKMEIGKLAANLIEEGDVVFFDCGSTIPFIASQINSEIKFTALCCSLNTFSVLQKNDNCELILCGGHYSNNNSFFNPLNHNELESIITTKSFISAAGVSEQFGVSCFNFNEAKVKQKAMSKSKRKILIFDHMKINQTKKAYIGEINEFDLLICDSQLPESFYHQEYDILTPSKK